MPTRLKAVLVVAAVVHADGMLRFGIQKAVHTSKVETGSQVVVLVV